MKNQAPKIKDIYLNNDIVVTPDNLTRKDENAILRLKTLFCDVHGKPEDAGTELITIGSYHKKGNLAQIMYRDSRATGFANQQTKMVVNGNDSVSILRHGDLTDSHNSNNLLIRMGQTVFNYYQVAVGVTTVIGITGDMIENSLDEHGGTLHVRYSLYLNKKFNSTNDIMVSIKPL